MVKRLTLYPFFFILFVILSLLVINMDRIDPVLAVRPAGLLLLLAAGAILLFRAIFKDWHYAGYLSFLIFFGFFTYGHLYNFLVEKLPEVRAEVFLYALLGVLAAALAGLGLMQTWRRLGGAWVTPFLNLAIAFILITQAVIGLAEMVKRLPPPGWQSDVSPFSTASKPVTELDCSRSPDIYWIVLDGYGRADALKDIYRVDTGGFLSSLEDMGFYVADQSHTNYIQTVYSIPSALNFSHLAPMPANFSGYKYFPELIAKNKLTALLRQCGYQTVAFESGFRFTSFPDSDIYFQYSEDYNEFEELLLSSGPYEMILERMQVRRPPRSYTAHRERINFTFEKLAGLPAMDGPQFIFAHILSPHPPFVFDARGNPVQPRGGYSLMDGSDYHGSWTEYREGYAAQVQHVNRLVEETVSAILARSAAPPVIIIQGDHGPGGHLQWGSPDRTCLRERTPILLAYYLPDGGDRLLYPEISPVNSFRVVLNAYFGLDMKMLPDETYFTSLKAGGPFIEVTEWRESSKNCGSQSIMMDQR